MGYRPVKPGDHCRCAVDLSQAGFKVWYHYVSFGLGAIVLQNSWHKTFKGCISVRFRIAILGLKGDMQQSRLIFLQLCFEFLRKRVFQILLKSILLPESR
jgi:hypothetical protein